MKRNRLLLTLPLIFLLSSCGNDVISSSSSDYSSTTETSSTTTETTTSSSDEKIPYSITHDVSDDYQINGLSSSYFANDIVSFSITLLNAQIEITEVKANDDILSGQSTFMVEMIEANNALSNATKDSLIVFDEIGRGTSTYDGMALAQAILEYIDTKIMAKTLFSTHYHELTNLENNMEHIKNKYVVVNENNGEISFLYKVKDGKADKSYGIHVASLAKLPQAVIDRANILLVNLTNNKKVNNDQSQIIMLETVPSDLKQIKDLVSLADINNMTPLEALQFVVKLKEIIKEK